MYLSKTRNHSKRESRASRRVISPSSPRNFTSRAGLRWKMEEVEVGSSIRFDSIGDAQDQSCGRRG